jgi:alkaline phosphatase D
MPYNVFHFVCGKWETILRRVAGGRARLAALFFLTMALLLSSMLGLSSAEGAYMTHGPVVGAVKPGSAKVFVRANEASEVSVAYSDNPDLSDALLATWKTARKKRSFTVHIKLANLQPNTRYYYDVRIDGAPQITPPYPSFQTFPLSTESSDFQFIALADTSRQSDIHVYEAVGQESEARFVVQLGDFPHGDKDTLAGSRKQYRSVYEGLSFSTFIAPRFPMFHTWDDHDYGINNSDKRWYNKENSLRAFKEYFPTPRLANPAKGVWHKFRFAQAEFFVLDCRSQRDRAKRIDDATKSMLDGKEITKSQKKWLKGRLLGSSAKWKFVLSSVPFNPSAKPTDSWGAYQTERNELLHFIADNGIKNVIVLSGDLHSGGRLDDGTHSGDPSIGVWIPELNVPHSNNHALDEIACSGGGPCGQWSEGDLTAIPGYGLITVETTPPRVILEIRDWNGTSRQWLVVDDQG